MIEDCPEPRLTLPELPLPTDQALDLRPELLLPRRQFHVRLAKPLLCLSQPRDVVGDQLDSCQVPVLDDRGAVELEDQGPTISRQVDDLQGTGRLQCPVSLHRLSDPRPVLGTKPFKGEGSAQEPCGTGTADRLERGGDVGEIEVPVDHKDQVLDPFGDPAVPLLAPAKGLLDAPPLREVVHGADHPPGPALRVGDECPKVLDRDEGAILPPEPVLHPELTGAGDRVFEHGGDSGAVVRVDSLLPSGDPDRLELLRCVTGHPLDRAGPADRPALDVKVVDQVAGELRDETVPLLGFPERHLRPFALQDLPEALHQERELGDIALGIVGRLVRDAGDHHHPITLDHRYAHVAPDRRVPLGVPPLLWVRC